MVQYNLCALTGLDYGLVVATMLLCMATLILNHVSLWETLDKLLKYLSHGFYSFSHNYQKKKQFIFL